MTHERLEEIEARLRLIEEAGPTAAAREALEEHGEADLRDLLAEVKRLRNDKAGKPPRHPDAAAAAFEEHLDTAWPGHREHKRDEPDK